MAPSLRVLGIQSATSRGISRASDDRFSVPQMPQIVYRPILIYDFVADIQKWRFRQVRSMASMQC